MTSWKELGISSYKEYFEKPHWKNLKRRLIYENPKAHCFLCGDATKARLLLHHLSYKHLGHEKRLIIGMGDIVTVCDICHRKLHFIYLGKKRVRIPTKRFFLVKRFYFLACIKSVQMGNIVRSLWFFLMLIF